MQGRAEGTPPECVFGLTPLPLRGAGTAASSRAIITKGAAIEREREALDPSFLGHATSEVRGRAEAEQDVSSCL